MCVAWDYHRRARQKPFFSSPYTVHLCLSTFYCWIEALYVIKLSHCQRDFVQTSRRENRQSSRRVTQFTGSSQDTLHSWLYRSSCAIINSNSRESAQGAKLESSSGRAPKPVPLSEILNEMCFKWGFQMTKNQVLPQLEMRMCVTNFSKSLQWTAQVVSWSCLL